jgi:hypothetical protein
MQKSLTRCNYKFGLIWLAMTNDGQCSRKVLKIFGLKQQKKKNLSVKIENDHFCNSQISEKDKRFQKLAGLKYKQF